LLNKNSYFAIISNQNLTKKSSWDLQCC